MLSPVLIYLCRAVLTSQLRQSPHGTGHYPRCVKSQVWPEGFSISGRQDRQVVRAQMGRWSGLMDMRAAWSPSLHLLLLLFLTIFSQANAKLLNKVSSLQAVENLHYLPVKHSCHQDRLPLCCVKSLKPLRWICGSASVSQEMSPWLFSILSYCIDSPCIYTRVYHCSAFKIPFWRKKKYSKIQSSACKQWNCLLVKMKGMCSLSFVKRGVQCLCTDTVFLVS